MSLPTISSAVPTDTSGIDDAKLDAFAKRSVTNQYEHSGRSICSQLARTDTPTISLRKAKHYSAEPNFSAYTDTTQSTNTRTRGESWRWCGYIADTTIPVLGQSDSTSARRPSRSSSST
jgi:hypothetical protein